MQSATPKTGKLAGILAAAGLTIALSAPGPSTAQSVSDPARQQQRFEMMQSHMKARLTRMGERLEIKASQQAAWSDYVKARESLMEKRRVRPAPDADAATVARSRAEFAGERARKLAVVSDATAKLQAVLGEDQRKVLNQMAQRSAKRGHHGGRGESHRRGWGPGSQERMPR